MPKDFVISCNLINWRYFQSLIRTLIWFFSSCMNNQVKRETLTRNSEMIWKIWSIGKKSQCNKRVMESDKRRGIKAGNLCSWIKGKIDESHERNLVGPLRGLVFFCILSKSQTLVAFHFEWFNYFTFKEKLKCNKRFKYLHTYLSLLPSQNTSSNNQSRKIFRKCNVTCWKGSRTQYLKMKKEK